MGEQIEIPRWRAEQKRGIYIDFEPLSFPEQRFSVRMEWNSQREGWNIRIRHETRDKLVTKGMANPYRVYSYDPWMYFYFADPSAEATEVTPQNLGDEMRLYAVPGPEGRPTTEC